MIFPAMFHWQICTGGVEIEQRVPRLSAIYFFIFMQFSGKITLNNRLEHPPPR